MIYLFLGKHGMNCPSPGKKEEDLTEIRHDMEKACNHVLNAILNGCEESEMKY